MNLQLLWLNFTIAVCLTTATACRVDRSTGSTAELGAVAIEDRSVPVEQVQEGVTSTVGLTAPDSWPPET
ncbi:MAG: hypothetical protein RLZZ435_3567, partial [Cyanobacteriota bacterium]